MPNLVLAFAELLGGAIVLDAGLKGDTITNVVQGKATSHPLAGASTGTGSGGATSSTGGANLPAGTYTNPVPGASPSRIDQGTDYTLSSKGFLAPGRSQILVAEPANSGWGGGGYIAGKLLDGPLKGMVWYVAENVLPAVGANQIVNAGVQVGKVGSQGSYGQGPGGIEAGWADPSSPSTPLAKSTGGYSEGAITAAGVAWNNFVKALGGAISRSSGTTLGHLTGPLGAL